MLVFPSLFVNLLFLGRHGLNIIILAKCRLIWNTLPCGEKVPGLSLLYSRYFDVTPGEFLGNILGSEDPRLVRSPEGFMEMHFNALNTNFRTMFSAKVNTENLMVMDVRPTQFDLHVQVSDLSKFIEKNWCPGIFCSRVTKSNAEFSFLSNPGRSLFFHS